MKIRFRQKCGGMRVKTEDTVLRGQPSAFARLRHDILRVLS